MKPVIALFLTILFVSASHAQNAETSSPPVKEASGIERNEKDVPVPQPKADTEIAHRLTKILNLTGWFEGLKVSSQEGIVTLEGKVGALNERDWAVDLANDADGVVAVINKIQIKEAGWFDLTSTKNEMKNLWRNIFKFLPHMVIGLAILAVSIVLFRYFSRLNRKFWTGRIANPILSDVVGKLGALPVLLIGLYLMLQVLGLTGLAFTLLGGTGALGLVAGFAFKNILENYFSGIMLSLRKPFVVGDIIEVAGEKGIVFKMTTRGTTLVDNDGKHILIPNSTVFTSIIRNRTVGGLVRMNVTFELPEGANFDEKRKELLDYLATRSEIFKSPDVEVVGGGTKEHPTLEAYFWVDAKKTSGEKLKNSLSNEYRMRATSQRMTKPADTSSDTQAILAQAARQTPSSNEQHL